MRFLALVRRRRLVEVALPMAKPIGTVELDLGRELIILQRRNYSWATRMT